MSLQTISPDFARMSPATFANYIHPERIVPDHVLYMSRAIRDAIVAGDGRIIVTMPPRHAKSDTISVHTPAWFLDIWPEKNVMLASYSETKAAEWGRKVRNMIGENPNKFMVRLAEDSKKAFKWNTPQGGGMLCTGVQGGLTGNPGDLIVIDDPIKNEEEAGSETIREKIWAWYQAVIETRTEPGCTIVLVMTRWNEDDLVGRLLHHQKQAVEEGLPHDSWTLINFPCVAEEEDELGRAPGEPLWPARGFDAEWVAKKRTAVGSRVWSALYQQRPSPLGGAVFRRKHFRYFSRDGDTIILHQPGEAPKFLLISALRWFQIADTAQKAKTINDYTAILTVAVTPKRKMLIFDASRDHLEVPDQLPYLDRMWDRFPHVVWQGVEDKGSGIGIIQTAARLNRPRRPLHAVTDKVDRASPAAVWYENGLIYHQKDASWLDDYEAELLSFPNGRHDDQVDCIGYAVREMTAAEAFEVTEATLRALENRDDRDEEQRYRADSDHPEHGEWKREQELDGIMPRGENPFG